MAHDAEIVGDEQVGEFELVAQVLEQIDDLRLDRHVERRDRLVADDEFGAHREGARDADALALARRSSRADSGGEPAVEAAQLSSSRTRASRAFRVGSVPCTRIGSAMMSPIFMRGLSEL